MFQPSCFSSHPAPVSGLRKGKKAWRELKLTFRIEVPKDVINETRYRKCHVDESGEYPYGFKAFKNLDVVLLWRQTVVPGCSGKQED